MVDLNDSQFCIEVGYMRISLVFADEFECETRILVRKIWLKLGKREWRGEWEGIFFLSFSFGSV